MSTGRFCWFDLMSHDLPATSTFYAGLFGWRFVDHNPGYTLITDAQGRTLGGAMAASGGQPSAWLPYVTTEDIDATVQTVRDAGGVVYARPEVEGIGRVAIFADPQGAVIAAIQLTQAETTYPRHKDEPHIAWSELHTSDPEAAYAFYADLFAWPVERWGGDYLLVGHEHNAGILRAHGGAPPHWLIYVNTQDTDATARRVAELGGHTIVAPQDLPGVGRFAVFADPAGAVFAVMKSAPRGDDAH